MAKARTKAGQTDLKAQRRGARMRTKVVIMELRGIIGFMGADSLDEANREDVERTILNCKDRLEAVARAFAKPPKSNSTEDAAKTEPAHA